MLLSFTRNVQLGGQHEEDGADGGDGGDALPGHMPLLYSHPSYFEVDIFMHVNFKACTKNRQNQHKSNRIHKNAKTNTKKGQSQHKSTTILKSDKILKSAKTNTKKGQSQHKSTTILKSDKTDTKKGQSQHNLKIKHDLPKMWTWTWWMGHGGYGGHGHGGPMHWPASPGRRRMRR